MEIQSPNQPVWALGLMSGTSLDGIDVACILTDGHKIISRGASGEFPYGEDFREEMRLLLERLQDIHQRDEVETGLLKDIKRLEQRLTMAHIQAAHEVVGMADHPVDLIGFHGQTILHRPGAGWTWQIGDGALFASRMNIPVVNDFRSNDMAYGGEGAPLAPVYHRALCQSSDDQRLKDGPVVVINIGGVSNVTYISADSMLAFDTGPGGALLDDWMKQHTGVTFDDDGKTGRQGTIHTEIVNELLNNPYFKRSYPKSLDRLEFDTGCLKGLSLHDGAATLTAFTTKCLVIAEKQYPEPPNSYVVAGGGRHNSYLMELLAHELTAPVFPAETFGWPGNLIEAELMAFLSVRSKLGLELSYPATTGCSHPITGGHLFIPKQQTI